MSNLLNHLKKRGINVGNINDVRAYLIGKEVEVIGHLGHNNTANGNTHGQPLKKTFKLSQGLIYAANANNVDLSSLADPGNNVQNHIYLHNLKLVNCKISINDFNAEIELIEAEEKKLKEDKTRAKDIIKYMQENEVGEFDDNVYKVYKIIKKVKSSGSDIEKATEIAKML